MKHDEILRLQAWMDGELTGRGAAEAEALAGTAEGTRVLTALRAARDTARSAAAEWPLPESREFFWSKVRRTIEAAGRRPPAALPSAWGWLRWALLPVGAAAGLALFLFARQPGGTAGSGGLVGQSLETPLDDMRALVFHSQSDGITVVWVEDAQNLAMY